MLKKLNLGCAGYKKEGYVNIDWEPKVNPDLIYDLNKFPYPFEDNSFDLVEADHVLEHLDRVFEVMKEIHRLLRPGGRLIIRTPHFSRGLTHVEHLHGFDVTFPLYFRRDFQNSGFCGAEFSLAKMSLKWMAFFKLLPQAGCGRLTIYLLKALNFFISFLANLSPKFCSRVWCFWVGGFEEIEFNFICKK